jgi:hypothetical protein
MGGGYPPDLIMDRWSMSGRAIFTCPASDRQPVVDFNRLEIVLVIVNFEPVDISPLIPPNP